MVRDTRGAGRPRVLAPIEALDALRAARGWHPLPLFYVIVGAVALLPAGVLALLTRVRWPVALIVIPIATLVVVFLWSMATVRDGRRAVLERVAPERVWREDFARELTMLREQVGDFRLIVPADWPGGVRLESGMIGVPAGGERTLAVMRVIADQGDPALDPDRHTTGWEPATPTLEICCFRDASDFSEEDALREFVARVFASGSASGSASRSSEVDDNEGAQDEVDRGPPMDDHEQVDELERFEATWRDRWDDGAVQVDGRRLAARLLIGQDVGLASFRLDGQHTLIFAEGIGLSSVEFHEVGDPAPLLDEFAIRRDRMAASWGR